MSKLPMCLTAEGRAKAQTMHPRAWTDEEVGILVGMYCHTSATSREIAEAIGRSKLAVQAKINILGLRDKRSVPRGTSA